MSQSASSPPPPPWLRIAFALAVGVLLVDVVYLLGVKFDGWIHADSSTPVLFAAKMLKWPVPPPILPDWYYPNGDVWALAPQLFALPFVAAWGVGPESLRASVVLGFAVELALLVWIYRRLSRSAWVSVVAAACTLIAWSRLHVIFVYCELSYGLIATIFAVLYGLHVSVLLALAGVPGERLAPRALALRAAGASLLMFFVSLQNPTRALVFALAPLLVVCAWPWRGVPTRARVRVAGSAAATWALSLVLYRTVFPRLLQFSNPSGHANFRLRDLAGVRQNLRFLAEGLSGMAGDFSASSLVVLPALVFMAGAAVLVVRELLASRAPNAARAYAVAVIGQLVAALLPMIVGNLLVNPASVRYLMPGLLLLFGVAVVVAARQLDDEAPWRRRAAVGWLALLPVVSLISVTTMIGQYSLESMSDSGQWAHKKAHAELADALVARRLEHGFATYWNANLVSLLSRGGTLTCPVNFASGLVPYKWNTDAKCFDEARLPDRVYVVTAPDQREDAARATRETFGEPTERFSVGDAFDVAVFDARGPSRAWLDAPLPEGDRLALPLVVGVRHPQMGRGKKSAEVAGARVAATGKDGVIAFGPYLQLPRGGYRLRWIGAGVDSPGEVVFDVAAAGAKDILARRAVPARELASGGDARELATLDFDLPAPTGGVEARVFTAGDAKVVLDHFVLERR